MNEERTIYITRDSFHFGDDVDAPHLARYSWQDKDWCPETSIIMILERYLGPNLPGFFWRGYANGKRIVDVDIRREETSFSREITLVENWREMLREAKAIHFKNMTHDQKGTLPESITNVYWTYAKDAALDAELAEERKRRYVDNRENRAVPEEGREVLS